MTLFKTGDYDAIAASGDATLRLIAGGQVAQLNTDLIPNYAGVFDFLKNRDWNTVDGKTYGVPHGYGANLLMYNTKVFAENKWPAPTSWNDLKDPKYRKKVVVPPINNTYGLHALLAVDPNWVEVRALTCVVVRSLISISA